MAETSTIEWTDATWNPITGCSVVSPGCTNCYAMGLAGTRLKHHPSRAGLTVDTKAGPVWNGQMRFNEEWLTQPLQWKRPRRIFVCAHGDLFAEGVPDAWIDRVFAVMALAPQHTFQVLTKRSARMRAYMATPERKRIIAASSMSISMLRMREVGSHEGGIKLDHFSACFKGAGPFPNVWLGVSCEDQRRADERVPDLLTTPAAVRFVSAEPLIGPIDFRDRKIEGACSDVPRDGYDTCAWDWLEGKIFQVFGPQHHTRTASIDWIIVGGESGPKARPMHPAWARSIRDQCAAAGVRFFLKQWGRWAPISQSAAADEAGWQGRGDWMILDRDGDLDIPDRRWPDEEAGEVAVIRVGKKAAGRLLDGVTHDGMPEARS